MLMKVLQNVWTEFPATQLHGREAPENLVLERIY